MTPEVIEWVHLAEADFGAAQREFALPTGPNIPVVYFHAQQCAEKLIKALLVAYGVHNPPKVHDLTALASLLSPFPKAPRLNQADLDILEPGAVMYRYPGIRATAANAEAALRACERVRARILPLLQSGRGGR